MEEREGYQIMEIWLSIKGYEGIYEVSNKGRVRSLDRVGYNKQNLSGIILKPDINNGYKRVRLYKHGRCKTYKISRLVAETFIDNPNNLPIVGHWNDTKTDDRVINLYWTNPKENMTHNKINLKYSIKIKGVSDEDTVIFESISDAGKNGFNTGHISSCLLGKRKTHKGYEWERG